MPSKKKTLADVASEVLKEAPWIEGCSLTSHEDCLEVSYLEQTYLLFGKDDKFWFENEGGNSSVPESTARSAFMSLLVFAFEWKLRGSYA